MRIHFIFPFVLSRSYCTTPICMHAVSIFVTFSFFIYTTPWHYSKNIKLSKHGSIFLPCRFWNSWSFIFPWLSLRILFLISSFVVIQHPSFVRFQFSSSPYFKASSLLSYSSTHMFLLAPCDIYFGFYTSSLNTVVSSASGAEVKLCLVVLLFYFTPQPRAVELAGWESFPALAVPLLITWY